jgi:hypothetical protein
MRVVTEAPLQRGYGVIKWQPPSHEVGTGLLVCRPSSSAYLT